MRKCSFDMIKVPLKTEWIFHMYKILTHTWLITIFFLTLAAYIFQIVNVGSN